MVQEAHHAFREPGSSHLFTLPGSACQDVSSHGLKMVKAALDTLSFLNNFKNRSSPAPCTDYQQRRLHGSGVPSPSFIPQKPEEQGWCSDPHERGATPLHSPLPPPRPPHCHPTQAHSQSRTVLTTSSPHSCSARTGEPPFHFPISPKTQEKERSNTLGIGL